MIYQKLQVHYDHCLYCLPIADHNAPKICVHTLNIESYLVCNYFPLFWDVRLCHACQAVVPRVASGSATL